MTTHAPYGPDAAARPDYPQHPPSTAYPTTPPWASPPEPAPAQPAAPPPFTPHGQLIVPFPEEMYNASRPNPPSWWPVAVWTAVTGLLAIAAALAGLLFGLTSPAGIGLCAVSAGLSLVGIMSASRRAKLARRGRNSLAPYWLAWGLTSVVLMVIGLVVPSVAVPVYLNYRENLVAKVVQSDLTHGKQLQEAAGVTASSAICEPVGARDAAGLRLYSCALTLTDGRTGTLTVAADSGGKWTAVPRK